MAANLFSAEPAFQAQLNYPSSFVASYPDNKLRAVVSISFHRHEYFPMIYSSLPKVVGSSFDDSTLTFNSFYYRQGNFQYEKTPRTVNARDFLEYRNDLLLKRNQSEFQSKALVKAQRDKAGGLLQLRIPIKSKAMESLFGEGGAGIKVSGYHRITFSGRSQWDDRASTSTFRQSKFPSLNMEQESRFDISGTIGTKISVSVSQDSKTDIPLANRIMLRYKGDEDDIIKTIEAGNTTLSIPNTRFVGYSSRIQGLFGIKAAAQLGPVKLTAIASQEKGSTERTSITAGASARKDYIRDYRYESGRIYDLGRIDSIQGVEYTEDEIDFRPDDTIKYIEVYRSAEKPGYSTEYTLNAQFFIDPANPLDSAVADIGVELVESDEYFVETLEHWIIFDVANAGSYGELGVFMIVKRADGSTDTIGNITPENPGDPYKLKIIRHKTPSPTYATWPYMWRNVYYLFDRNIDLDGLELKIFKGDNGTERLNENIDHQDGIEYIKILGLDRYNLNGGAEPDGIADVKTNIVDSERGLLIFPDRFPFNPTQSWADSSLKDTVSELYNYANTSQEPIKASTYYIEVSNRGRSAQINLGKPNIIEGSERISLNGRTLKKGSDYTINYSFGQVTFLTDEALDPNANLSLDFEYAPFIAADKKTLFGVRAEYEKSSNLKFGSTFLYKSDKATARKPKVGQETARTIVWDVDGSFKLSTGFMTKAANLLPLYHSDAKSNMSVSGEFAQSIPNPNVEGVAYVDDFEGSREAYSLGIYRQTWHFSSKPVGLGPNNRRARMIWYNPFTQVATDSIWRRELAAGESGSHTLWVEIPPAELDLRIDDNSEDTTFFDPGTSWAGIMRYMSAGSVNQENAQLLEIRLKGEKGIIHIDMGQISEDVNGNDSLDTEDNESIGGFYNNILDDGEDIGLDGVRNDDEEYDPENGNCSYSSFCTEGDPHGDNWYYNGYGVDCNGCDQNDYSHINGTDTNAEDPDRWGKPDSEDINNSGSTSVEKNNNYFSYKIDLESDTFYVEDSEYNGWRTYRIPIKDPDALDGQPVGTPDWSLIEFVRLWFESPDSSAYTIKIASMDLIQSNWEDTILFLDSLSSTTRFNVAVINTQENSDVYNPPSGVTGYYDQSRGVTEPEQSLLLHYEDLTYGDTCLVERVLYDSPSYTGYRRLQMFVHGPDNAANDSLMYFFRIGQDNKNYYAFQDTLQSGWNDNGVDIDFNEITALKEFLQQSHKDDPTLPNDTTAGNYRIVGMPNINRVKYFAIGVRSLNQDIKPTGDIWFDELRLSDVRKDIGIATRVDVRGNVADLFSYSVGYTSKNSYFTGLSTSTRAGSQVNLGSGKSTKSYNVTLNLQLAKFLPKSFGASLPLSLRYSKTTDVPQLKYNTDIILPDELKDAQSTVNVSKGLTLSESFNKKTKNPLFTILLNNLKTSFSYSHSEGRSPATPITIGENYNLKGNYGLNIRTVPHIKPFFWTKPIPYLNKLKASKFYFFPGSYTLSGTLNRTLRVTENLNGVLSNTYTRDFQGSFKTTYRLSDKITTNYSMDTRRDMSDPETVNFSFSPKKLKLGRETSFGESFGANYDLQIFSYLTHKLTYSSTYKEKLNVSDSTRTVGSSKSYGIAGSLDLKRLFGSSKKSSLEEKTGLPSKGKVVKKERGGILKRITRPFASVLYFLTSWADPFAYDYNQRYNYTILGLADRAQWKFRFGLTDEVGAEIDQSSRSTGKSNAISKNTGYSLRSGTNFFGGLKADVGFSRKITQDIEKSSSPMKSISTTFPEVRFTIRPLRTHNFLGKLLNPLIKKFGPRTGYSRSTTKQINLKTGNTTKESESWAHRPLLSLSITLLRSVSITFNTEKSVTESRSFNSLTGDLSKRDRMISKRTGIQAKYSFSAPSGIKIPLLGRLRFKSTMSISVDIAMRKENNESASGDLPFASTGERTDFTVTPTISYSFSSQIKGGLSGRWQDTNDVKLQRKSHVRELRIWVDIRF